MARTRQYPLKWYKENFSMILTDEYTVRDLEWDLYGSNRYDKTFTYKSKYNYSKLNYRLIVGDLPMNKRYGTITVWLFESGEHGKDEMCGSWHKDPYSCSNKLSEAEETKNGGYFIEVIGRDKDDIYDESYHNPSSRGKDKYCSPECVVKWKLQAFIDDMADLESKRLEEE